MRFFILVTALLMSMTLEARPRFGEPGRGWEPGRPGSGRDWRTPDRGWERGNVTCSATDNGWEEHFGGHSDCRSCLAKHGSCTERCTIAQYRCQAEGRVRDHRTGRTRVETFFGQGSSRWDAEDEALRDCRWSRAESCQIKTCLTDQREVSRRSCR